ncbi:MAG: hypothetical protein JSV65_03525 [Armatimonadota bacterium]|nr:MAG: hypothetical protein JSV65_03525 [Armatimonadota bacterium]
MDLLFVLVAAATALSLASASASVTPRGMDLTEATIILDNPTGDVHEAKAVQLLVEEVKRRSGVEWPVATRPPADQPVVALSADREGPPEGYSVAVRASEEPPLVAVAGNDIRGRLFGIGRLLRALDFADGRITLDADLDVASAPQVALRGHQPSYRAKSNSYDAWDKARYEQYLRDLIIFGANALEIVPSITPDDVADSAIMPVDPWEMTLWLAEIAHQYGLIVCLWVPNTEDDILTPDGRRAALENRRRLYEACRRVDEVFVPGGDPGNLHPRDFMPLTAEHAALLKRIHPESTMWVSAQNFRGEALDYFYEYLQTEQPDWLDGIVYAPWVEDTMQHMREAVPARYALRRYPDICHTVRCQYPVPAWDQAFAITANREPIAPRPTQYAHIYKRFADLACGFVTYSDGIADDVNKFIWNVMGWDRDTDVRTALVEYGRVYISQEMAEDIADGILALERNWERPAADNDGIAETLVHWQALERRAGREVLGNWRFQQMLLRAYYDAYVQARLRFESGLEQQALRALARAGDVGCDEAAAAARSILSRADAERPHADWRARIDELADDLWESIGAQLTVERHHASGWERGAMVTTLDWPLNNRGWIEADLAAAAEKDETEKLAAMRRIVEWEDAGPGGFYDNLGQRWSEPHLVVEPGWDTDPGFCLSAQDEFGGDEGRLSWRCQGQTLFGTPLRMRYEGLDPDASYRVRVTYAGRHRATAKLAANGRFEIHGELGPSDPVAPVEFDIPRQATAGGALELTWSRCTGRGVQVAEVWLLKQ